MYRYIVHTSSRCMVTLYPPPYPTLPYSTIVIDHGGRSVNTQINILMETSGKLTKLAPALWLIELPDTTWCILKRSHPVWWWYFTSLLLNYWLCVENKNSKYGWIPRMSRTSIGNWLQWTLFLANIDGCRRAIDLIDLVRSEIDRQLVIDTQNVRWRCGLGGWDQTR